MKKEQSNIPAYVVGLSGDEAGSPMRPSVFSLANQLARALGCLGRGRFVKTGY